MYIINESMKHIGELQYDFALLELEKPLQNCWMGLLATSNGDFFNEYSLSNKEKKNSSENDKYITLCGYS